MPELAFSATTVLLVLIVALSLWAFNSPEIMERMLLRPAPILRRERLDTLVTSGFIHADLGHLAFNLIAFYSFGQLVENYFTAFNGPAEGTIQYLILYFISLLAASLFTVWMYRDEPGHASLGASGAVSGIVFAGIALHPGGHLRIFPFPFDIPAPLFGVGYLAYTVYAGKRGLGQINHWAHLAGAVAGLACVMAFHGEFVILIWKTLFFGGGPSTLEE